MPHVRPVGLDGLPHAAREPAAHDVGPGDEPLDERAVLAAGEVGGELGVAGGDHRPTVDKDLGPYLLGDDLAVERDGATLRGRDAVLEAQVGGVLRRVAHAAPPQDRAALDDVVEPALPDLGRAQVRAVVVILQGAQESEGPGDVVVGDDEGVVPQVQVVPIVDVVVDLAELALDPFVVPPLKRPPQVDADDLAEHPGVDALFVVFRDGHGRPLPVL